MPQRRRPHSRRSTPLRSWIGTTSAATRSPALSASIALAQGDAELARASLDTLTSWQPDDFLAVAETCAVAGDHRCAADGYIQASIELGFGDEGLPEDIHDLIWRELSLSQRGPQAFIHRYHHAWWLLQQEVRDAGSLSRQRQVWDSWRSRYPSHPATLAPPSALARLSNYRLPMIAVLLPLSGRFTAAGEAVRDGLLAAYLAESTSDAGLSFVDTQGVDIAQAWEEASALDPDVIVGPLLKANATRYAEITAAAGGLRLALNYIDPTPVEGAPHADLAETTDPELFQFGIAIEDEARSLAAHVLDAGHERTLVVRSEASWASRAHAAFVDTWPHEIADASFADAKALTEAVGGAMQVDASTWRKQNIANILGQELEFLPRARSDLDSVVAFVSQIEAESLKPALRFHFADDLPVYTTSQAARGEALRSVAGYNITQIPIVTAPSTEEAGLAKAFRLRDAANTELYALGFDAYRLAAWLPVLGEDGSLRIHGATGEIVLTPGGVFRRELLLSRVTDRGEFAAAE